MNLCRKLRSADNEEQNDSKQIKNLFDAVIRCVDTRYFNAVAPEKSRPLRLKWPSQAALRGGREANWLNSSMR